jgi:hypothetical protein
VWWTNRRIHLEREMACDEMVVAVTGAPRAYAACLTYLAGLTRAPRHEQLAVGAVGASSLRRRVRQVLVGDERPLGTARLATTALMALLVGLSLWVGNVRVFSPAIASAALLEAQSLVAQSPMTLPGAVQAPAILTPAGPVDAGPAIIETHVPRARSAREVAVGVVPDNAIPDAIPDAALDQQAAKSSSASGSDVPGEAGQPALPSQSLPAFGVPLVPALLPSAGGGETAPEPRGPAEATNLWNAAADAGGRIGRTSQKGAVTTAGFFTRMAKNISRSF